MAGMALPVRGDVFLDARDEARALRLSWTHEGEFVVLPLWRDDTCAATFRLTKDDVPALVGSLVRGLAEATAAGRWHPTGPADPATGVSRNGPRSWSGSAVAR
jgi:hypothetical protein